MCKEELARLVWCKEVNVGQTNVYLRWSLFGVEEKFSYGYGGTGKACLV